MQTDDHSITLFIVITCIIICGLAGLIILLLFLYQRRQNAFKSRLSKLKNDYEKNLLRTQVEMQEQTFESIGREIHDNINLSLTLAKLNLNSLNWLNVHEVYKAVDASVAILSSAIGELTNLSRSLNPEQIRSIGLVPAIRMECDKLQQMARLDIDYRITGEPVFMESEKELIIFRILQEAFLNILRHAKANNVWLELSYNPDLLDISLRDDGVGFDYELALKKNGAGMTNMQTRAKLFAGDLTIETELNSGTCIHLKVPYQPYGPEN